MKIKKVCQRCGKEFFVIPSHDKKTKYCSLKCCYPNKIKKICATCKVEFKVIHSRNATKKYCSKKCYILTRKRQIITRICQQCSRQFEIYEKKLKYASCKYCSPKCWYEYTRNKIRKKRIIKICPICSNIFSIIPSSKKQTCSYKCARILVGKKIRLSYGTEVKICPICKNEFFVKPSTKAEGGGFYCSWKCYKKARNDGSFFQERPRYYEELKARFKKDSKIRHEQIKGMSWEQLYGKEKAEKMKKEMSDRVSLSRKMGILKYIPPPNIKNQPYYIQPAWKGKSPLRSCLECGKEFRKSGRNATWCSSKCYYKELKKMWKNDDFIAKRWAARCFKIPKNELTDLDQKIIKAKVLLIKIKRQALSAGNIEEVSP